MRTSLAGELAVGKPVGMSLEPLLRALAPVVVREQAGDVAALGGVTLVACPLSAAQVFS